MIQTTKQIWQPGEIVNVGFMKLRVLGLVPTPGDHAPDAYVLGATNGNIYRFVPHRGLVRCVDLADAMENW